ncbi:hypothetical protein [Desulfovibrio ferrophilus]|uniref:Malate synthase n=1 Tax=Desulfovibrio ferrophilus TaxID=241368 RepID=A0A2Z6B2K4_9BACT|nr:hypothetical protein [Desulfovibrio ferrophilus]BBD09675.1 malate synthase [Desulfovibrio ferrophilus]
MEEHLTEQLFNDVKKDAKDLANMLPKGDKVAGRILIEALPILFQEIELSRQRNESLRDALEFYADMSLWDRAYIDGGSSDSVAAEDGGETARLALRGM